jgi:predicted molibdopterin-dependent oxidoreductase YjgC
MHIDPDAQIVHTVCRICMNHCALKVEVKGDAITAVRGDPGDPMFGGFSCIKGRTQHDYLRSPDRIMRPLKRIDGAFHEIPMEQALDAPIPSCR